jgi:hypothetical protein
MESQLDAVQAHRSSERLGFIQELRKDEAVSMHWRLVVRVAGKRAKCGGPKAAGCQK